MDQPPQISIKILVLGPCKSGKTVISNYLADSHDMLSLDRYRPTQGVRIVEFESNQLEMDGQSVNAEVELWDCSGDRRFESCWPAIRHRSHGAIFVCDPSEVESEQQLRMWYGEFAARCGIPHSNLMVLLHHAGDGGEEGTSLAGRDSTTLPQLRLPTEMEGIPRVLVDISRGGEELRLEFNNFLCHIIADVRRTNKS